LVGLSAALRAEYGSSRFGVTALCPGFVHTPLVDELYTREAENLPPEWMFTDPDTVAAAAIRAIRRNKGIVVVTPMMGALWLLGRLSPAFVDWLNRRGWRAFGWRMLRPINRDKISGVPIILLTELGDVFAMRLLENLGF
jgi:short-subunit dehydrogenase